MNWNQWKEWKRCFVKIENKGDNLCCARAIVTGKAEIDEDPQYNTIKRGDRNRNTLQKRLAQQLMEEAGLGDHQGPCGLDDLKLLQNVLEPDYQVKVFSKELCGGLYFKGEVQADKVIHLYLHGNHVDLIISMPAFFDSNYFCEKCTKTYEHPADHRCNFTCPSCYWKDGCQLNEPMIPCQDCNRYFRNQDCFDRHKEVKRVMDKQNQQVSYLRGKIKCLKIW
jgi:hypothetical protein